MNSLDLSGPWHIRPDPHNVGLTEKWHTSHGDASLWKPIAVPSGWQSVLGVKDPAVAWYRRSIDVPRDWLTPGARLWLRFDAVATDATVFINSREVGRHIGNWAPFHLDVTDALAGATETAELMVRVDKIPATPPVWIDGAPVFGGHITKGFHDILSIQTAGIWDAVRLERTGGARALPSGVSVIPDVAGQSLSISIELDCCRTDADVQCTVLDPDGAQVARARHAIGAGSSGAAFTVPVPSPRLWWPESPELYTVTIRLVDRDGAEEHTIRSGFRTVYTGGANNERLLLNGRPIFLSGVLDWGHEPERITPTTSPEELRERFAHLKDLGFNCVCLCMWYPPEYFFDIADEMGMLLWQEHPVWKPWMGDELIEPFKEQFVKFFRRDANHASVVLVSGSCEHERFNPTLATWWWNEARRRLPDRALQIQTAFFAWTDPEKTDLWDEHTYESAGRWVRYLDDLQLALKEKKPKPFIMGEAVIYTSWPDVPALTAAARSLPRLQDDTDLPFWYPKGLAAFAKYERELAARYGEQTIALLRTRGDHYNLRGRKFQMERYRAYANHAGHVQNHLRDVPSCRCGFADDLNRWRFTPEQTRPWIGPMVLLFETPDQRRGFVGGRRLPCRIGLSNFGEDVFTERVHITMSVQGKQLLNTGLSLECPVGDVRWLSLDAPLPAVDRPTPLTIRAETTDDACRNAWTLWILPPRHPAPAGVYRQAALDFVDADDMYPDFEEHAYSSGWGLKVRNWVCPLPNPATLVPDAAPWKHGAPIPEDARVIVAHKLTDALVEFLQRGGRVVHITSKTLGSAPNQYVSMWGQVPLLLADHHLGKGVDDVLLDLLDYDLTRRTVRTVPTGQLGIDEAVAPLVRLIWTHDMQERPKLLDSAFATRVGEGVLVVSSLDHTEDAGHWFLDRLITFARDAAPATLPTIDPREVRRWTLETLQR